MNTFLLAWIAVICALIVVAALARYKYRSYNSKRDSQDVGSDQSASPVDGKPESTVLLHRLCPHNKVVQGVEVQQKDSLDEHLDMLTRKLAEKEGRLQLSKTKIRETQFEIDNLHALDSDVRAKYKDIMDSLRSDLTGNEKECMKLQEQIEWVSRKRAEIGEEVNRTQTLYGKVATELTSNLKDYQKGCAHDNPQICQQAGASLRHRMPAPWGSDELPQSVKWVYPNNSDPSLEKQDSMELILHELNKKLGNKVSSIEACNLQIEEVKHVMTHLDAIDRNVRRKYSDLISTMRQELLKNELQCKQLQDQIYWVTKKRVEIGEEINRTTNLFEKGKLELVKFLHNSSIRGNIPPSRSFSSTYSQTQRLYYDNYPK